jgi:hypothetical protein
MLLKRLLDTVENVRLHGAIDHHFAFSLAFGDEFPVLSKQRGCENEIEKQLERKRGNFHRFTSLKLWR